MAGTVSLHRLVDDYVAARARQNAAAGTIKSARWALDRFVRYVTDAHQVERIDQLRPEHLEAWQDSISQLGAASRSLSATFVRSLLRWAQLRDYPVRDSLWMRVESVKVVKGLPRPLPPEDLDKLLAYLVPRRPELGLVQLRDRALILYALGSAARIGEILRMQRSDFEAPILKQKGGGERLTLAPPIALEAIRDYLAKRTDESPWLWISLNRGLETGPMPPERFRQITHNLARKLNLRPFRVHDLRHTAATLLLDARVPIEVAAEHLGHANLGTIQRYGQVRPERRREALDALQTALGGSVSLHQDKKLRKAMPGPVAAEVRQIELLEALAEDLHTLQERLTTESSEPFLRWLADNLESELDQAGQLVGRLSQLLPGPAPLEAVPVLRVLDKSNHVSALPAREDWRDDPAAVEIRFVYHPARGIRFEVLGERLAGVDALNTLGGLVAQNPQLGGWLFNEREAN